MAKRTLTAGLIISSLLASVACVEHEPQSAATPTPAATAPGESADASTPREADDPAAGTNTNRPDSPQDIQPEPGTPTPTP